jgi:MscS family membrane protein
MFHAFETVSLKYPKYVGPDKFQQSKYIFLTLSITYFLLKWKNSFSEKMYRKLTKKKSNVLDPSAIYPLSKILSIIIITTCMIITLDIVGVPVSALLAFGGVGGLAISWAAKDVVANFFGGLMIFVNRPFIIGDWIKSPNKNFEGVVEEIGWYRTQIRSFERRPTYIPNSIITDAIVENPGRMYNRRLNANIGLRYKDITKIPAITKDLRDLLANHEAIDQSQTQMVHFVGFGAYSLDINMYAFTKTTQWADFRNIQQDMLMKIAKIVLGHGADFAFPTQSLLVQGAEIKHA